MKTVLIGVVLAMAAAPVLACNSEMLVVQDWLQSNGYLPAPTEQGLSPEDLNATNDD